MLFTLTDEELMEAYQAAIHLKLEQDFILLLEKELQRRNLNPPLKAQWV